VNTSDTFDTKMWHHRIRFWHALRYCIPFKTWLPALGCATQSLWWGHPCLSQHWDIVELSLLQTSLFVSWNKCIVPLWENKRCSKDMGKFQRPRHQIWTQVSWSLESEHIVFAKMTKEWSRENAMIKVLVICYIQFSPGIKCCIKNYSWRRGWKFTQV